MSHEIRYIAHNQIDKRQWDSCVESSVNRLIYAYSWYLDIVATEWDALVHGDYEAVFPLPFRKKAGIKYLYQPPFTQQLGVFSKDLLSTEMVDSFLKMIPPEFKLVEINLNTFNRFSNKTFSTTTYSNFVLDLISSYESLSSKYSENLRRNLKKAAKSGITLVENVDIKEAIEIFKANKGEELGVFTKGEYPILVQLVKALKENNISTLCGALTPEGNLCAAAVFINHFERSIFLFSATNDSAKEFSAMPFIIDNQIRKYAGKEYSLDFEGSNNPDLARFYRSFGSTECSYSSLKRNSLNPLQNIALKMYKKYR